MTIRAEPPESGGMSGKKGQACGKKRSSAQAKGEWTLEFLEHFRFLYDGVAYFFKSNPVLTEDGVQMVPGWKYLVMFVIGGVLFAKLMNLFLPQGKKINPMVGGAGISAFPMSARVIQKMALKEDNQNHLLMHAVGANVAGQIGSVVAGGIILTVVPRLIGA